MDTQNTMNGAVRIGLVKAASLAMMLTLAIVVVRPLVPLAAHLWTLNATIADSTAVAEHGVLPAKTVLRTIPKLRYLDPIDPPQSYALGEDPGAISQGFAETQGICVVGALTVEMRSLGHPPRGPPSAWSAPRAAALFEYGRALGSLERANL
ncbi:MAG: hypothetical protein AB7F89_07525 [Pirellulaceae bacterium]